MAGHVPDPRTRAGRDSQAAVVAPGLRGRSDAEAARPGRPPPQLLPFHDPGGLRRRGPGGAGSAGRRPAGRRSRQSAGRRAADHDPSIAMQRPAGKHQADAQRGSIHSGSPEAGELRRQGRRREHAHEMQRAARRLQDGRQGDGRRDALPHRPAEGPGDRRAGGGPRRGGRRAPRRAAAGRVAAARRLPRPGPAGGASARRTPGAVDGAGPAAGAGGDGLAGRAARPDAGSGRPPLARPPVRAAIPRRGRRHAEVAAETPTSKAAARRRWTTSPGSSRCCRRRSRNRSTRSATRPWR